MNNFHDLLGVNAHAWYVNNNWPDRLLELSVKNVRGKPGVSKDFIDKLSPFFAAGGKLNATIVGTSSGTLDKVATKKNLDFLKSYAGTDNISAVEGPNEYNNNGPKNWASLELDFVRWLHDTIRSDPAFNNIPIVAPSMWKRQGYDQLGDISAYVDKACIHYYSGQKRPTLTGGNTMQGALSDASTLAPGKPMFMTETGWQAPGGSIPISNRAASKYLVRNYFDAFGYGVEKVFYYQLMDDQTNLFGLCDANANPKPQFYALKNLSALTQNTVFSPSSAVVSGPKTLKTISLTDGTSSFLALYLDVDSYNVKTKKDVETSAPVTVTLPAAAARVETYLPTFSDKIQQVLSGQKLSLSVSDEVLILKI